MKKMNWTCTSCGMSSGRKFSVKRHIDNYNIHGGDGQVVSFVEYTLGRREGKYQLQEPLRQNPRYTDSIFLDRSYVEIRREVENLIVKEIARRIYQKMSEELKSFNSLETLAMAYIIKKDFYKSLKAIVEQE